MTNFRFNTEQKQDGEQINKLHQQLFGPARFTKAAHLLREYGKTNLSLSHSLYKGDILIGSVRITPIKLGITKALLLGPLAIDSAYQNIGLGSQLMNRTLSAIEESKSEANLVMLIGDYLYYKKFGFSQLDSHNLIMPAPIDPARILGLELKPGGCLNLSGIALADI